MIDIATDIAFAVLGAAIVLVVIRVIRGPTLADRVLGLDLFTMLGAATIGVFAIRTQLYAYADLPVVLVLIGFVATAAFARYILSRAMP